jgi:hypothetical protein
VLIGANTSLSVAGNWSADIARTPLCKPFFGDWDICLRQHGSATFSRHAQANLMSKLCLQIPGLWLGWDDNRVESSGVGGKTVGDVHSSIRRLRGDVNQL